MSTVSRKISTSRSTTPKRSTSPKQVPQVPRVPSGLLSAANDEGASAIPEQSEPHPENAGDSQNENDVDSLSAGVRKLNIKLKVPSPEENAAREKKAAEERKKPSKTSKSPRTSGVKPSLPSPTTTTQPSFSQLAPPPPAPTTSAPIEDIEPPSPMVSAIPSTVTIDRPGTSRKTSGHSSSFVSPPLTPGGGAQDTFKPQSRSSLFPSTTSTGQSKHGLPTFTSTDAIPFASGSSSGNPTPTASRPSTSTSFSQANSEQANGSVSHEKYYHGEHS